MNYELKMILDRINDKFICVYGDEQKCFNPKKNLRIVMWRRIARFTL